MVGKLDGPEDHACDADRYVGSAALLDAALSLLQDLGFVLFRASDGFKSRDIRSKVLTAQASAAIGFGGGRHEMLPDYAISYCDVIK